MQSFLADKLIRIHTILDVHQIPHAFGGAIALAFYSEPRNTRDIDINIALLPAEHARVLDSLSALFVIHDREKSARELSQIAQTRLHWDNTGIDLFFADTPFNDSIAQRTREVDYVGIKLPIISAEDLIILKAAFNRPKDWIDIEAMFEIYPRELDATYLRRWLSEFYTPPDDAPLKRIEGFLRTYGERTGPGEGS